MKKKKTKQPIRLRICFSCTSIGRGAPKVANPTLPGANVTLPGRVIPWIPHRPAYIRAPYSSTGLTLGYKRNKIKYKKNLQHRCHK